MLHLRLYEQIIDYQLGREREEEEREREEEERRREEEENSWSSCSDDEW